MRLAFVEDMIFAIIFIIVVLFLWLFYSIVFCSILMYFVFGLRNNEVVGPVVSLRVGFNI